jgi:hypothetical protein
VISPPAIGSAIVKVPEEKQDHYLDQLMIEIERIVNCELNLITTKPIRAIASDPA